MSSLMVDEAEEVLNEYAGLVRSIVRSTNYSYRTLDADDLMQIGNLAVLRAIKAYDPSCGTNIRSFVANAVRQDVYREAARFLGILTVDFRVTKMAAKVTKLLAAGTTELEVGKELNLNPDEVRDLRMAYTHRDCGVLHDDHPHQDDPDIYDLLHGVANSPEDRVIMDYRILSKNPIERVMDKLGISMKKAYALEASLKSRILSAIDGIAE
jgi:RNA polymerase sigma factor (sigma-70 family)